MSFAIFDERYYLANNPDVQAAVSAGTFKSGLEHFQIHGQAEGRTSVSPYYDEQSYLQANPDVASAVEAGTFKSGLQHFIQFGETEGRSGNSLFDEQLYLQRNSDVAAAVEAGSFKSGWQHFLQYGKNEGRSGTYFNEDIYLDLNPDVATDVQAGSFKAGIDHYTQYGQYETQRLALFSGTSGNDTVTGFGEGSTITGVDINRVSAGSVRSENLGRNEVDTLIGGPGTDLFVLGNASSFPGIPVSIPQGYYEGNGDADYATIKNFEQGKDTIQFAGYQSFFYTSEVVNGNLNVSTINGDLVAVVEGVTSPLSPLSSSTSSGIIQVG